jgi:hypothetical protein
MMDIKEKIKKYKNAYENLVGLSKLSGMNPPTNHLFLYKGIMDILEELQKIQQSQREDLQKTIGYMWIDIMAIREHVANISDDLRKIQQAQKPVEKVCEWKDGTAGCTKVYFGPHYSGKYCPDCGGKIEVKDA